MTIVNLHEIPSWTVHMGMR